MGVGYAETWNKVIMAVEAEMVKKKDESAQKNCFDIDSIDAMRNMKSLLGSGSLYLEISNLTFTV